MDNPSDAAVRDPVDQARNLLTLFLRGMGSLKLTVALLAMSIFLVFAGTLAQVDRGIWTVMSQYFRCWLAHIDPGIFVPSWNIKWSVPFPGGWMLGTALLVNLVVSHASRIRLQARGGRLVVGSAILAIGMLLTWIVISRVFNADSSEHKVAPSMRVTLQLLQGGGAALILFMGCKILFGRKAGIVLLHAGIVLMMFSELITARTAQEGMMRVGEGQTVNYVESTQEVELAFTDRSNAGYDDVVVIPQSLLVTPGVVSSPELPFDVEIQPGHFFKNARLHELRSTDRNPATQGVGLGYIAEKVGEESGTSSAGTVDLSAAYIGLREKQGGSTKTEVYLVAVELSTGNILQPVVSGGKTYDVQLRFKRTYKPYEVYLKKFRFERYPGTEKPKDFSSFVRVRDLERGTDRDVRIWMNNPLRYRGDTLYQADWDHATEKGTVLQIVTNQGWMVPYVGCMIVAVGLLGQFLLHLFGFLSRRRGA
jgi:hypothetical protein